jgi:outer membrane protein assembly factor BamB/adenine/guanine phosphoribosyltransferase-like PRPP-binding protein
MTIESVRETILKIGLHTQAENIPLITSKGKQFNWLFDLRRVFMDRDTLAEIARLFWERNKSREPFQLAGLETAAIPLLTALMLTCPKEHDAVNGFIIRKDRKTVGMGNAIEGVVNDLPIILVDDALNSGKSAEKARAVISMAGHALREMFVVVDFLSPSGRKWRQSHGMVVETLFTPCDFNLKVDSAPPPPIQEYRELWRTATPGGFAFHVVPKSAPLLIGNRIYRGCDAAKMQAFSTDTGGVVWEYQATAATVGNKGIWSCPAYHNGRIYFGAYNGTIYCLDAETGKEIWTQAEGEWVGASPLIVNRHNLVCFGIEYTRPWAQGSLGAYDLDTGEKVWEHSVVKLQHGSPGYWEGGDLVIWGSADHETLALDGKTGNIVWRFPTRRSVKYAPVVDEQRKLTAFASFDKSIYILDVATGKKRGEWQTGEICYTTPLFIGNKLFCGSGDRHLYVIDVDRMELIKKIYLYARVYASPKRIGDRVIVPTTGGRVVEIDIDTLETKGILQLPDAITNAVAVSTDERRIYVSTYMNHLYAFERLTNAEQPLATCGVNEAKIEERVAESLSDDFISSSISPVILRLQNFECVQQGIDILEIRDEVLFQPRRWRLSTSGQDQVTVQRETENIFLRAAVKSHDKSRYLEDVHESTVTPHTKHYPAAVRWVEEFAQRQRKGIARVLLAKLKPHGQVCRHIDGGEYYRHRDRYHLVLSSISGSPMRCGDEEVVMQEGELWWFDNKQVHEAFNPSDTPRIHLIFDLESPRQSDISLGAQPAESM